MEEAAASPLAAWESFYVILASSAAVLTGLVFLAITFISDDHPRRSSQSLEVGIGLFNAPTVVHFCAVLLVAAALSAPWEELSSAGVVVGLAGLVGMAYSLLTIRRMRRQDGYRPEGEDWAWYAIAPFVAYATLVVAAALLPNAPRRALFGMGAVLLALLFVGLRNAWDVVTYMALQRAQGRDEGRE
jgi:hypothetical protein